MWVKNCIKHRLSLMGGDSYRNALLMIKGCYPQQRWSDCVCTGGKTRLRLLAKQTRQQRNQGDAHQSNAAASHELFYPQIGVKPCSMAGGGVSETIWNCLKTAPAGTGQPLTCSTSGMGLRLKWISMEMCRVLSLSMCSWTTISLIRRFRVAASSSVMSAYS